MILNELYKNHLLCLYTYNMSTYFFILCKSNLILTTFYSILYKLICCLGLYVISSFVIAHNGCHLIDSEKPVWLEMACPRGEYNLQELKTNFLRLIENLRNNLVG